MIEGASVPEMLYLSINSIPPSPFDDLCPHRDPGQELVAYGAEVGKPEPVAVYKLIEQREFTLSVKTGDALAGGAQ